MKQMKRGVLARFRKFAIPRNRVVLIVLRLPGSSRRGRGRAPPSLKNIKYTRIRHQDDV